MTAMVYHGTGRLDFTNFDIAKSGVYNIGLHFGTKAAAKSRIEFLRKQGSTSSFRILACELTLQNPLRIDDVFGRSYGLILNALKTELERQNASGELKRQFVRLSERWLSQDDDPSLAKNLPLFAEFNKKMNIEIRRLFSSLGYDGFVYMNELEDGESKADSYCVFNAQQVAIIREEAVVIEDCGAKVV